MKRILFIAIVLLALLAGCVKIGADRNLGTDGLENGGSPPADSNNNIIDENKQVDGNNAAVGSQDTNTFKADDLNAEQEAEQTTVSSGLQDWNGNSYTLVLAGGALSEGIEKALFELYDSNSGKIASNLFGEREDIIFYDAQGKSILKTTFYIKSISTAVEEGTKKYFVELYRNIR
ncbi:MAG: membrane lipoprotein lipid attachment site-containing protein [Candidatus Diapherotrites archaeon]|nr:membrane lipoprotein lipid attachment site-containing protein [Candidatus Diapherotrites archaeon]